MIARRELKIALLTKSFQARTKMHSQVVKLRLFLVWALYSYSSYWCSTEKQPNLAEAFLFHQLQPAASSPTYSSFYENSTTTSNKNNYLNKREYNNRQNNDQQSTFAFSTRDLVASNGNLDRETDDTAPIGCPIECHCNKVAQIADCSNRNLLKVPSGFPKDIKRIRLERNNITELGPYAFQGLKRLQRIDLSNNNLLKIDPLAFAGGLQSLNSLILYSNKLNQLPVNLFSELSQLQLLLLNANSLQCINKELFQSLTNLNLLSLYDNNIETLANGTFDGLKNIKTIHLGKNPLICDCNLRWLADYLELNPIETSEARCESPTRNQAKKLSQLNKSKFRCEGNEQSKTDQIASQCADQSCPQGCACKGATVDCSRASLSESRTSGGIYELPDIPDDVPVYVTRMRINDQRIKRIRQTGLFRRLANSQKLDLGNNKIIDIEDNAINGLVSSSSSSNNGQTSKPERVVFVLLENEHCSASAPASGAGRGSTSAAADDGLLPLDACAAAPRVNPPNFDSPCYNGGSCQAGGSTLSAPKAQQDNYTCLCPPGFVGPLCEVNVDDCAEHQCQNGALCVDGINSYRCVCRDPTTSGEFCEQLSSSNSLANFATNSANSIAPLALPMIAASYEPPPQSLQLTQQPVQLVQQPQQQQQILARSANFFRTEPETTKTSTDKTCKRVTQRKYYDDGNGCQSVRVLKISKCVGGCGGDSTMTAASGTSQQQENCGCKPAKVKRKRVRMQCNDGASYVKTIDLIKKCACSNECYQQQQQAPDSNHQTQLANQFNVTQEDQLLQITRLDAVD